uniref:NADH-ubiquinone oxidoreductase chain 2 n=1 Tax=Allopsontus sp. 1 JZ-2014 TaxID=1529456 RepID=A0A0B4N524_9INSE|nr:NADH dehydrogenase subunit 2 [Allopsontus sp. 1 JZ-2014]
MLFFMILISSTLVSVSSTSWFGAWLGLEINLLSFIPILSNDMNQRSSEASLKYFLTQALGSITLISGVIMLFYSPMDPWPFQETAILSLMSSALLLKMGAAPFHFWFPVVMEGLTWMNGIILMTWQKLGPLALLSYNVSKTWSLIIASTILSSMVGALGGLNQSLLRKVMAFSSINHMGWIMAAMTCGEMLWLCYFIFYILLSSTIGLMFSSLNIFHINQIYDSFKTGKNIKLMLSFSFLSLGGLPPFTGFIPKWLVIQNLMINKMYMITLILIFMALLTLYYYSRIIYSGLTSLSFSKTWHFTNYLTLSSNNLSTLILSLTSTVGLPTALLLIPFL